MGTRRDVIVVRRRRVVPDAAAPLAPSLGGVGRRRLVTILRRNLADSASPAPSVPSLGGVGRRRLLVIRRRNVPPEPQTPIPTWLSVFNTITFGGLLLPPPTIPETDGATLFDATRNYLKSLDSMGELTEVYKNRPKKGWQYPYMVISSIGADSELTNGPAYFDDGELQFSTVSDDDIQAETIGEAAYNALLPNGNPRLTFDDGFEKVRIPLYHNRMTEGAARGPGNTNVWTHTFGYKILTGRVTRTGQ